MGLEYMYAGLKEDIKVIPEGCTHELQCNVV